MFRSTITPRERGGGGDELLTCSPPRRSLHTHPKHTPKHTPTLLEQYPNHALRRAGHSAYSQINRSVLPGAFWGYFRRAVRQQFGHISPTLARCGSTLANFDPDLIILLRTQGRIRQPAPLAESGQLFAPTWSTLGQSRPTSTHTWPKLAKFDHIVGGRRARSTPKMLSGLLFE